MNLVKSVETQNIIKINFINIVLLSALFFFVYCKIHASKVGACH